MKSFKQHVEPNEVYDFHYNKYVTGQSKGAITTVLSVFRRLKNEGIPCYRLKPSQASIEKTIDQMIEKGTTKYYQKKQLAILGIKLLDKNNKMDKFNSYKEQLKRLELQKKVLELSEDLQGSYNHVNDYLYFIYTTRGEINLHISDVLVKRFIEVVKIQSGLNIGIGVGIGYTILDAETNLYQALNYLNVNDSEYFVIIDESNKCKRFNYKEIELNNSNNELIDLDNSQNNFEKLKTLTTYYNTNEITTNKVAKWFRCTDRNARRIINNLVEIGFVEEVGEEQAQRRGRPNKIYKLHY